MYGLGKEKGKEKFMFDLELEMRDRPGRSKELLMKAENRINEIKTALREGASETAFDKLGVLLHAYTALQRVLKKVVKQ